MLRFGPACLELAGAEPAPRSRTLSSPGFWTRESPATAGVPAWELGAPVTDLTLGHDYWKETLMRRKWLTAIIAGFVVAGVGAAAWWDYGNGWKLARDVVGRSGSVQNEEPGPKAAAELCEAHGFAEDDCYQCNPQLVDKFKSALDWCNEHNLPESQCALCDPYVKFKVSGDWCKEHGLPRSQCVKCDPSLATEQPKFVDWCEEHQLAESQCTICNPNLKISLKSDWCQEHNVRDSECILCHPELRAKEGGAEPFIRLVADTKEAPKERQKPSAEHKWCEHGFDKGNCFRCDAKLEAKFKAADDWCGGHKVPESQCLKCQDDVAEMVKKRLAARQKPEDKWCEHGFEKGNCFQCDPKLEAKFKAADDWCGGHVVPESQCLKCNAGLKEEIDKRLMVSTVRPDLLEASSSGLDIFQTIDPGALLNKSAFCGTHLLRIKFSRPDIAKRIDLKVAPVRKRAVSQTIRCNAEVAYNSNNLARLSSRFEGIVTEIRAVIGKPIKKGDVLAIIESPELGEAKIEYLTAEKELAIAGMVHDRIARLAKHTEGLLATIKPGVPASDLLEAWKKYQAGEARSQLSAALNAIESTRIELATTERFYQRWKPIVENVKKAHEFLHKNNTTMKEATEKLKDLEVGKAKSEMLEKLSEVELTRSEFERQKKLLAEQVGSQKAFLTAKKEYETAVATYDALLEQTLVEVDKELLEVDGRLRKERQGLVAAESEFETLRQEIAVKSEMVLLEAQKELQLAENALKAARGQLTLLGLTEEEIRAAGSEKSTQVSRYSVRAPFDGTVIEREAVRGEVVEAGEAIVVVADLSTMWVKIDVFERELPQLQGREDLPVRFRPDGLKDVVFEGKVIWLGSEINDKTRTVQVLAEVENTEGLLRAHMFGQASTLVHQNENVIVVPKAAVQWEGCCHVVFVQLRDDLYAPRKVRLGYEGRDFYEVKVGLLEGEPVVTQGSFLLKTEILKSSIGAGCTD